MKYLAALALALAVAQANPVKRDTPYGIDVSDHQPNVDWNAVQANGIQFVSIKATEGTYYISETFDSQYTGATNVGLIRGGYHFARPDTTSGADQANYFLAHGGGWSADGITLPGMLDIEYNPYGDVCYDQTADQIVQWVQDFSDTYNAATGRPPVIYTTTDWWTTCAGNSPNFGANNPLWIADYASSLGPLPAGWGYTSFWQYASSGPNPGDADLWNGSYENLQAFATGG